MKFLIHSNTVLSQFTDYDFRTLEDCVFSFVEDPTDEDKKIIRLAINKFLRNQLSNVARTNTVPGIESKTAVEVVQHVAKRYKQGYFQYLSELEHFFENMHKYSTKMIWMEVLHFIIKNNQYAKIKFVLPDRENYTGKIVVDAVRRGVLYSTTHNEEPNEPN